MLTPFSVTLPWNPSDADEGTYATTVWADNCDEAVRLVAEEMAEHPDGGCGTDEERAEYVKLLIADGGYVVEVAKELVQNMQVVFEKQLFPDGCIRQLNLDVLSQLLEENRDRLVIQAQH